MWIRSRRRVGPRTHDSVPAWSDWDWWQGMDPKRLESLREAVRAGYEDYVRRVLARGEQLARIGDVEAPLGFTPNALVSDVLQLHGVRADFFNIRYFFHAIQTADGDYESGPQRPFRTRPNVLLPPKGGW
jgi:hypothetical protein